MSFFTEYDERTGVCFQLTPEEVKVFAEALAGGGTKEKRTLEGQSETQLRYLLKGQVIDDAAYLAELKARGDSDSEAQGKLRQASSAVPAVGLMARPYGAVRIPPHHQRLSQHRFPLPGGSEGSEVALSLLLETVHGLVVHVVHQFMPA